MTQYLLKAGEVKKGRWLAALVVLLIVLGMHSCKESGCADPNATNYDSRAQPEGCSCSYLSGVISFTTNTERGGPITVELKKVECYDGDAEDAATLIYNPKVDYNDCYSEDGKLNFNRYVPQEYGYRATDNAGNVWESTVELIPEQCQQVILTREAYPNFDVIFYTSQSAGLSPTRDWNVRVDDKETFTISLDDVSNAPVTCTEWTVSDPGVLKNLTKGKHIIELYAVPDILVAKEVTLDGESCTYFDLSQLIQ